MSAIHWDRLAVLGLEAVLVALVVLGLFRARRVLGLAPLLITLGVFQPLQTLLASALYVEIAPGLLVSPGSVVLFSATLVAVLLVYIREGAGGARRLIYGLLAANIVFAGLLFLFSLHLDLEGTRVFGGLPRALFVQSPRVVIVGTMALYADFILIILAYETISRLLERSAFLRVFLAMALVLGFDTLFFATGVFAEKPEYLSILVSGMMGKTLAAFVYSAMLVAYLRLLEDEQFLLPSRQVLIGDVFRILTLQKDGEPAPLPTAYDLLTGLYNQAFFLDALTREVAQARRFGRPTSVLIIELDELVSYKRSHGWKEANRMLVAVSVTLSEAIRSTDIACRLEGDEFGVILSDADRAMVRRVADGIRYRLSEVARSADPPLPGGGVTAVIATGTIPHDTDQVPELLTLVRARKRAGMRSGGDCVIAAPE